MECQYSILHTIETARDGIVILDHALIDENPLGPIPCIDEDGVDRRVDRVDDEAVGEVEVEEEIRVLGGEIRAVQVADDSGVPGALGREDGVVGAGIDVVGLKVEVVEGGIWRGEDAGLELEGL